MIYKKYLDQINVISINIKTEVKTYISWNDTENGRDCSQLYEKSGDCYINVYNRTSRVCPDDEFYDTLDAIYNLGKKKKEM